MSENDSFDPYEKWLGIPPEELPADHYRLLGLERFESDVAKITQAADQQMVHIRTFQTGPRGALTQKILNEISASRICLTEDDSRDEYDRHLRGEPAEVNIDVAPPTPTIDPMAPMGTAMAVDPMAPIGAPMVGPPVPGGMPSGAGDPMAPVAVPTAPAVPQFGSAQAPAPQAPAPQAPAPQTSAPQTSALQTSALQTSALLGSPQLAVSPRATSGIQTAPTRRGRKGSLIGMLLVTVVSIGAVAGAVWGIGQAVKRNNAAAGDDEQLGDRKDDDQEDISVSTSDSATHVMQEADGGVNLSPVMAKLNGSGLVLKSDGLDSVVSQWTSQDQWVAWHFRIVRTGLFQVEITYASTSTGEIIVEVGGQKKQLDLRDSKGEDSFVVDLIQMRLDTPGEQKLVIRPASIQGSQLMRLKSVRLTPRDLK
jgi:hypothetical protein